MAFNLEFVRLFRNLERDLVEYAKTMIDVMRHETPEPETKWEEKDYADMAELAFLRCVKRFHDDRANMRSLGEELRDILEDGYENHIG